MQSAEIRANALKKNQEKASNWGFTLVYRAKAAQGIRFGCKIRKANVLSLGSHSEKFIELGYKVIDFKNATYVLAYSWAKSHILLVPFYDKKKAEHVSLDLPARPVLVEA